MASSGQWRPANLTDLTKKDAAHVVNQLFRETNARIDSLVQNTAVSFAGQAVLNFGTIPAQSCTDRPVYVTGASQQHVPHESPVNPPGTNLHWSSFISQQNQVTIRVCNPTVAGIAAHTVQWRVKVI